MTESQRVTSHTSLPTASAGVLADLAGKVWSQGDLQILHTLRHPVVVTAPGLHSFSYGHTLHIVHRVVFQNLECLQRFGPPRSMASNAELLANTEGQLSSEQHALWCKWHVQLLKGEAVEQPSLNVTPLLRPLLQGVAEYEPGYRAKLHSQTLRYQSTPDKAETAELHIVEPVENVEEMRTTAMHHCSPVHAFMFDCKGQLLNANKAAVEACCNSVAGLKLPAGQDITLKSLFDVGFYPGGEQDAREAYEEAVNAIFVFQVTCHRHIQPHQTQHGSVRWEVIEMWPMQDPVTDSPAVLVKRHNITKQNERELQLFASQEALQRHNQALEQDTVSIQADKLRLEQEALSLSQTLSAVMNDKFEIHRTDFDAETPIDKVLNMMHGFLLKGEVPARECLVHLYKLLSESDTQLRQPVALEQQLHERMSSEVGQSMLQLLQGKAVAAPTGDMHLKHSISSVGSAAGMAMFIPAAITPAIERLLKDAETNWQFDIFAFVDATPGTTLSMLTFHLLRQADLIRGYHLDEQKLCNFLQKIESGYSPDNPYHNSIHAASVVQMTHMLLCHGGLIQSGAITRNQHLSSYWSAAVHDYEHGGLNNDFLIKTMHPLAALYNDQSPLENHHMSAAAALLGVPEYGYIESSMLRSETIVHVRTVCVNQVLGTDMKKHFDITSRFQSAFKRAPPTSASRSSVPATPDWDTVKTEDKTLVYQMVLKCADIGHLAVDPVTHKRWAFQLEEEFFKQVLAAHGRFCHNWKFAMQGDKEKEVGLGVSPLMDRSMKGGMTRSQMGFFSIVGIPLFKAMADLFEDAQPMLDGVMKNFEMWKAGAEG